MKILASTGIRSEYDILYPVLKILNKNNYNIGVVVSELTFLIPTIKQLKIFRMII